LSADPDGRVHDYFGGVDDLQAGRVRFVGDPETRIREDYLRILRFFRFFAWYGHGEPDAAGLMACSKLKAGLATISAERIWMEMKKLLSAPAPLVALEAMGSFGVLTTLFPNTRGLELPAKVVALEGRAGLAPDPMVRFLALFWKDPGAVHEAANRLKMSNEERHRLNWAAKDLTDIEPSMNGRTMRRALYTIGQSVFRDRVVLAWAQQPEVSDMWKTLYDSANAYERPALPVTGDDMLALGVAEGPAIGDALRKLEAEWIDSDFKLQREQLLAKLK
jgi:poly(A) polymerase